MLFFLFTFRNTSSTIERIEAINKAMANSSRFLQKPNPKPVMQSKKPSPKPIFPEVRKLISITNKPNVRPPTLSISPFGLQNGTNNPIKTAPIRIIQRYIFFLRKSCIPHSNITIIKTHFIDISATRTSLSTSRTRFSAAHF